MPPSRQSSLNAGSSSKTAASAAATMNASASNTNGAGTAVPARAMSTSSATAATSAPRTPSASSSMDALMFAQHAAMSTGRATPQSSALSHSNSLVNRPGSASAVNRRRSEHAGHSPIEPHHSSSLHHHQHHHHHQTNHASSHAPHAHANIHHHHQHYGQHHPYANVFDEEGPRSASAAFDDEHGKGHGVHGVVRRGSTGFAQSSGRWTPTILTNMLRRAGEGRFSPVNTFHASATSPNTAAAAGAQHASPQSPHHRFFFPSSPRMKVLSAEPDDIPSSSFEQPEQPQPGRKTPGSRVRTSSSFVDHSHSNSGPRLGLVKEKPHDKDRIPSSQRNFVARKDDLVGTLAQNWPSRNSNTMELHKEPSGGAAGYYAPSMTANTESTSPLIQSRMMHQPSSHAHKMSSSSTAASSHSIQMHSPQMHSHSRHASLQNARRSMQQHSPVIPPTNNSSPLVVPQARRGAVNLRKGTRRRNASAAARRQRAMHNAVPAHVKVLQSLRLLSWSLCHPLNAVKCAQNSFTTTCSSIDASFRDPRTGARNWRPQWLGAYIPLLIWLGVSLSSTFTVLIWHTQVFQALDRLSSYLQSLGMLGRFIFGSLIFLTTFPPLPLYSTLIILCGFSFGLVQGFIISYIAALSGAIVVFLMSRSLLKGWMVGLLNQSGGLKKVVRAIEKRPKLLFLVRLAPYPYNLMNTLLASSPTLTLKTYTLCTALALPKLLVHCGLGTTIKNFAAYNGAATVPEAPISSNGSVSSDADALSSSMIGTDPSLADQAKASETAELIKHVVGFVGVGLCIGIFLYLYNIARKAVDEELDEDELAADEYELVWSDDGEDEEQSVDGLDEDDLNIANGPLLGSRDGSSESMRLGDEQSGTGSGSGSGSSGSRRTSSQAGHDTTTSATSTRMAGHTSNASAAAYGPGRYYGNSEATLVEPRPSALLSIVNQKGNHTAKDGTTPLFIAHSDGGGGVHGDGSGNTATVNGKGSYFGGWTGKSVSQGNRGSETPRTYAESRVSLADSIAEMEKHADLLDEGHPQEAIFDLRHDISIELSPPPAGRRAKLPMATIARYDKSANETPLPADEDSFHSIVFDNEEGVDERRRLGEVDRNRASRRSQVGYEEEHLIGAN